MYFTHCFESSDVTWLHQWNVCSRLDCVFQQAYRELSGDPTKQMSVLPLILFLSTCTSLPIDGKTVMVTVITGEGCPCVTPSVKVQIPHLMWLMVAGNWPGLKKKIHLGVLVMLKYSQALQQAYCSNGHLFNLFICSFGSPAALYLFILGSTTSKASVSAPRKSRGLLEMVIWEHHKKNIV